MTTLAPTWGPQLGKMRLAIYGEDEVLRRNHRKASSRPIPGRMVWSKPEGKMLWSTLHERGNRKLVSEDFVDCHTWVRNALTMWVTQFLDADSLGSSTFAAGHLTMRSTDGTVVQLTTPGDIGGSGAVGAGYRAAAADDTSGIQAGHGDKGQGDVINAYSFEDIVLDNLIGEGTTSGDDFNYSAMDDYTVSLVTYSSFIWTLVVQRFMNNNSGMDITVEEVALVADTTFPSGDFMMARDVLGGDAKLVADEGQFDCTYTITSPTLPA